jgi:endonuclease/exonuclease/phosphatase family metal-dependent hydrolase
MQSCLAEFGALQPGCTQCLAANLSKPLEEIFATCTTASAALSYQGRNGLILLSKRELDKTEHLVLDAFLIRRVVLHATFKDDPAKTHVFCTHLSAALSEMEYAGKYASWEEEQAAQIDQMLEWVDQQAGKGRVLVLGDMNCGPEVAPDITAAFPENYAKFDAAGYGDPYSLQAAAGCTWCTDNTLVEDTDANQIIDHVLIQGLAFMSEILTAERILDDLADVTVGETPQKSNLSDHFGVWVHE